MTIPLKGSRTEKNLAAAFAAECMARNRYTYFASKAKKQGYEQIAALFLETAENEREHGKIFLKLMNSDGTPIPIRTTVAAVSIGSTLDNLRAAAAGEKEEYTVTYPHSADVAEQEGFDEIANTFRAIAQVEAEHEKRFTLLAQKVENGTVFKRSKIVRWKCRNCGYVFEGQEAPNECPACGHPQGFYEIKEVLE
ncbi:Rubrerythrin [Tritrichomonas foetus]|uniref:Rubrerythrin n=1 Tax=Tritrichomonas foetus TaxID=1144522 RepID=A0A1J4KUB9_9EUKA|nr:Rubrerythrin [Tritrichomonas foetus]|eukprot:OHT14488.1 Rubrerythrin [Tritrichomonas foetus]